MDALWADSLTALVAEKLGVKFDVVVHQSIASTNSWCLQQSKSGKGLPFACFAEMQTSGRGRRGKQWFMSPNSNVAMSLVWPFVLSERSLHLLPMSVALAIVATLEDLGLKHVQIKWPNDIYVQGKKIAGVLIETQPIKVEQVVNKNVDAKYVAVVIGLGLNYRMLMPEQTVSGAKISYTDICEQVSLQKVALMPERHDIAAALLCNVIALCQDYERVSRVSLKKFRVSYDYCKQKKVEIILDNDEVLSGVAQGVNDDAELLVLIEGEQRVFNSAEISVRADNAMAK